MSTTDRIANMMNSYGQRFWSKVKRADSCWEWQAGRDRDGYGVFQIRQRLAQRAHRVAYELHFGPIQDGMLVCHTCDNPSCVNPAHLFLGTHLDNVRDMAAKGRRGRPTNGNEDKTHCKRGHLLSGPNVRIKNGGRHCRTCSLLCERLRNQTRWTRR